MVNEKVTFNINRNVKKQVKQLALDKETTATKLYNEWILEGMKKEGVNIEELLAEWSLLDSWKIVIKSS